MVRAQSRAASPANVQPVMAVGRCAKSSGHSSAASSIQLLAASAAVKVRLSPTPARIAKEPAVRSKIAASQSKYRLALMMARPYASAVPVKPAPGVAIQEGVLTIQQHWTDCLREGGEPETTGVDNLRTLELVFGAYEAAASGMVFKTDRALGT